MTDRRFDYDDQLLRECADSALAAFVETEQESHVRGSSANDVSGSDQTCIILFQQHASHYGRTHSSADASFERIESQPSSQAQRGEGPYYTYKLGGRLRSFVKNVLFVQKHNMDSSNNHRVGLNRFSDMNMDELFSATSDNAGRLWENYHHRHLVESGDFQDLTLEGDSLWNRLFGTTATMGPPVITPLRDTEAIINAATHMIEISNETVPLLGIGKGSMNKLSPTKYKKIYRHSTILDIPHGVPKRFQSPEVEDPNLVDGSIMSVKILKDPATIPVDDNSTDTTEDADTDNMPPNDVPDFPPIDDEFVNHLNWATTDNPDGVPIVHDAFDQGTCGSCWAFAAAGSLEASASRRAAHAGLKSYIELNGIALNGIGKSQNAELDSAVAYAQQVEHESFQMLNLSVQELVDCDTSANEGCTGGNPLLSFFFIHRYGLAHWKDYPYIGKEDTCHDDWVKQPIATVKSWGVISPNHEKHMELVLRYLGPIAVGVNGARSSFLAYTGGVYEDRMCKQGANHALLITGYGREEADDGTVVRYWYARNSWGTGWGENGYVRVKRGNGHKGEPGVCGISRSPSVALGGVLLPQSDGVFDALGISLAGPSERFCGSFGLRPSMACIETVEWIGNHKAISAGVTGALLGLLSVFLLAGDYRRRNRLNRIRDQKRQVEQERLRKSMLEQEDAELDVETSALLDGNGAHQGSYGTQRT